MSDYDTWLLTPAIPANKVTDYLLNVNHPEGGPKARYFLSHGFTLKEVGTFIEALFLHAVKANFVQQKSNNFTSKLIYEAEMPMPDGTTAKIRSVWQVPLGEATQTLVTAYRI